jgi:hypothetical protein
MSIGRVPGATGIQPSIVTAKGDLIVATASGSVTNQAVGSNNQVLTADSAQADGVKWANGSAATLTTTGDIIYASAANTPARLGIGSSNQVLTVSGGVPTWATPAGGGKVLQVVQGTNIQSSDLVIASTTFTDTGLSVTITPSASTSKILILVFQKLGAARTSTGTTGAKFRILRNSTEISATNKSGTNSMEFTNQNTYFSSWFNFHYLDSPASTSALTYKAQVCVNSTTGGIQAEINSTFESNIIAMEIGA